MKRISGMILLLSMVIVPVILFVIDSQRVLAANGRAKVIKEASMSNHMVYSAYRLGD